MGCQNSRLVNPDVLAIPPKIRPLLWRKFQQIRRGRRRGGARSGSTLSKKDLLTGSSRHGEAYDALSRKSLQENDTEMMLASHETDSSNEAIKEMERNDIVEKNIDEANIIIIDRDHDHDIGDKPNVSGENNDDEEENMEKRIEEGGDSEEEEDDERNICPASPSFRVYYIESLQAHNKVDHDQLLGNNITKDGNVDDMQKENGSIESLALEDVNVKTEDKETKIATKSGKNRMRIRAILRGPVAMRQLLSVTSCYHPSTERASLLAKKSY